MPHTLPQLDHVVLTFLSCLFILNGVYGQIIYTRMMLVTKRICDKAPSYINSSWSVLPHQSIHKHTSINIIMKYLVAIVLLGFAALAKAEVTCEECQDAVGKVLLTGNQQCS
jgi:hypothetical protein